MNPSEHNEYGDNPAELSEQVAFVASMEQARLDAGSAGEYMAVMIDRYETDQRNIPALFQLRRIADFTAQSRFTPEFADDALDTSNAFYAGSLLAYDVAIQHYDDQSWPLEAATLFGDAMHDVAQVYRGEGAWTTKKMQLAADELLINAEWDVDDEGDSPIDGMVRRWAAEMHGYSDNQRYMMMGFRHIFTLITDRELAMDDAATFEAMMVEAELDQDFPHTRTLDDLRRGLWDTFVDHKITKGPIDMNDGVQVTKAINSFTYDAEAYMNQQDELLPGDDVSIRGFDTSYIIYDDSAPGETIGLLAQHERIEGEFVQIETMQIPVIESASQLHERVMGKGGDVSMESSIGKTEIVSVVVLKHATIVRTPVERPSAAGTARHKRPLASFPYVPQDKYVAVVLNPTLEINVYE